MGVLLEVAGKLVGLVVAVGYEGAQDVVQQVGFAVGQVALQQLED